MTANFALTPDITPPFSSMFLFVRCGVLTESHAVSYKTSKRGRTIWLNCAIIEITEELHAGFSRPGGVCDTRASPMNSQEIRVGGGDV